MIRNVAQGLALYRQALVDHDRYLQVLVRNRSEFPRTNPVDVNTHNQMNAKLEGMAQVLGLTSEEVKKIHEKQGLVWKRQGSF